MAFLCPDCSTNSLSIGLRLELPPDCWWDEITLQAVECSQCGFVGIAVYEESRRGAVDTETIDHRGYRVSADDFETLKETIKQCPEPGNWRCECSAHRRLGRKDASGRWNALDDVHREGAFELRFYDDT